MRVKILIATGFASAISALCLNTDESFAASKKAQEHPDFTGVWIDAEGLLSKNAPPFNPFQGRTADVRNPPPLKPEYQSQSGRAQLDAENKAIAGGAQFDPGVDRACPRGLTGSMPGMMTPNFAIQIVQHPKIVLVMEEVSSRRVRQIYTDGRKHPAPDELVQTRIGESIGHWEGDTLVVETIGITPKAPGFGLPASDKARITERFYFEGDNLHVDISYEDPVYMSGPWKIAMEFERSSTSFVQYDCAENPRNTADMQIVPKGASIEDVMSKPAEGK